VWTVVFEYVTVGFDVDSTVKDSGFDFWNVLGEAFVFVCDLECEFSGVTQYKDRYLVFASGKCGWVELVEGCKYEYCGFAHTGFSLTYNIHSEDCLGDAFVLDFGWMFESAVYYGTETFWFEDEVFESGCMDSDIVTSVDFIVLFLICDMM